jgi:hypothetical protein
MCGEPSCLPMTNNTPPLYNFRMEALHIVAPAKLASGLIATVVVTPAVTLNAPACGYGAWTPDSGSLAGAFNWLISVDKSTNTVTTGGGIPVDDPYSTGYSFLNGTYGGIDVAPRCSPVTFVGSRFSTKPSDEILNVPIFPTVSNTTAPIILPIRGAEFSDVAISPDGNCIGDLNPEWAASIGSMCSSAPLTSCPKWFTSGSLAGYITLDDADNVGVLALGLSLCSLLQGLPSQACGAPLGPTYQCCTAPEKTMGDYCSTGGGKGCTDSVWLSATFAANAVKIDKSSAPACAP